MITGGTLNKEHFFHDHRRLHLMQDHLLTRLDELGWEVRAWACLSNHYHVLALSPDYGDLSALIRGFHSKLAIELNKLDHSPGRRVMYQYWDRCVTSTNGYFARLNYVMQNPVKHGVVKDAQLYPFCSARWFHRTQTSAFRRRVTSYGIERVSEPDDF